MRRGKIESHRPRNGVVVALLVAVSGLLVAACSSPGTPAAAPTTTSTSMLTPEITTPTVTIDGHTYQVPTEDGTHPIGNSGDSGGQIVLTDKGFLPHELFATLNQTVTWTNLSSHPVRITFLHMQGQHYDVPIGGTFTYKSPTLTNFEYVSSTGYHGIVTIGAFQS